MPRKVDGVVRVALIGSGGISAAHAKGFIAHADKIRCVALCDVSPENLKKRNEQLAPVGGGGRQFADWKVMLREMGGELDAVDICLPHHLHAPAILDAAAAGKHVLCEKPMCMDLAEADRIAEAVRRAGVTYMSAHNQLFMPVVREAKRLVDAGEIGRVLWLRSQDCFRAGGEGGDPFRGSWRASLKTQGGGELIDTGYHPSYRLLHLAGSPAIKVHGTFGRFAQRIEGEDTASVQVRFASGAIGEILTSWAFPLPHGTHHIHVMGERGEIYGSSDTIYLLVRGEAEPARREFEPVDTFVAEIEHFADTLRAGRRPIHSVEEGRAVLELILRASQSAQGWMAASR
ncbi:MAG TPA: Gfo/Idh/MocA family oxidoreductase [Tepidisphaeraceae bacterium]|nr:Gfo/Idh/MocA family oxidoreductase [Tepidisphaeraceae bacterium]